MSTAQNKRRAAEAALPFLAQHPIVGIGTGSTVDCFIDLLGTNRARVRAVVSSSSASTARLTKLGIEVIDLNDAGPLPLYVDGADEATVQRALIKGGGGALTREKILAQAAEKFVCIVDETKLVPTLGRFPLPIEVIPMARELLTRELAGYGGRAVLRAGFVTDNGNHILDVHGLSIPDPALLESQLNQIPGVVTVGLFARRPADVLLVGGDAGVRTV
ncbi:MAG TPA: ribose-5-phosphate isomerase RpiA [Steroidobacteraceae bacterium]|nr:ribose-5-phosphate isomerase RpiA [Steroidobacteraceae bacterium]